MFAFRVKIILIVACYFLGFSLFGFEKQVPAPKPPLSEYEEMQELADQFLEELKDAEETQKREAEEKIIKIQRDKEEAERKKRAAQNERKERDELAIARKLKEEKSACAAPTPVARPAEPSPATSKAASLPIEAPISPQAIYQRKKIEETSQMKHAQNIFMQLLESLLTYKPIELNYSLETLGEIELLLRQFEGDTALQNELKEKTKTGDYTLNQFIYDFKKQLKTEINKRNKPSEQESTQVPPFAELIIYPAVNLKALTLSSIREKIDAIERINQDHIELARWAHELKTDIIQLTRNLGRLKKRLEDAQKMFLTQVKNDLNKSNEERKEEEAQLKRSFEIATKKIAEEPPAKVREINAQFPQFFENIPQEYQLKFLNAFEKRYADGANINVALKNLYSKKSANEMLTFRLIALADALGYESYYMAGYVFCVHKKVSDKPPVLPGFLDTQTKVGWAATPEARKKLQDELDSLTSKLVNTYKIHLMPKDTIDQISILLQMDRAIKNDPELNAAITVFKILVHPYKQGEIIFPKVVIYAFGKDTAQKILNRMYPLFKEIPGLNIQPRFNARVTDLIWIAQGDGDYKGDRYEAYYERPNRVYYKPDITGKVENYHLINPETGKEIV